MSRQSQHQSSEPPPSRVFAPTRLQDPLTRLSSPLAGPSTGPRFRSISRDPSRRENKFQRAREASQRRLYDAWDAISAKYAAIRPEDDDEVDIYTGRITVDRGRLRALEAREFADGLSDGSDLEEAEDDPAPQGPEAAYFGPEEDELGDWDDRSGLDVQEPPEEVEEEWTVEDEMDLRAFHAAEARLRGSEGYPEPATTTRASVFKDKRKIPSLEDLFLDSESETVDSDGDQGERGSVANRVSAPSLLRHSRSLPSLSASAYPLSSPPTTSPGTRRFPPTPHTKSGPSRRRTLSTPRVRFEERPTFIPPRVPTSPRSPGKGKQRMEGERPSDNERPVVRSRSAPQSQPAPPPSPPRDAAPGPAYLTNRSLLGSGKYRECSRCCSASGRRKELAAWCRGRLLADLCPFEEGRAFTPSPSTNRRSQPPVSGRSHGHGGVVSASVPPMSHVPNPPRIAPPPQHSSPSSTSRLSSTPSKGRQSSVMVLLPARRAQSSTPALVREASTRSVTPSPRNKGLYAARRCKSCVAAGGLRAERAGYCGGRNRPWMCAFSPMATSRPSAAVQSIPTSDSGSPTRRRRGVKDKTPSPRRPASLPARQVTAPVSPRSHEARSSPRSAGPDPDSEPKIRTESGGYEGAEGSAGPGSRRAISPRHSPSDEHDSPPPHVAFDAEAEADNHSGYESANSLVLPASSNSPATAPSRRTQGYSSARSGSVSESEAEDSDSTDEDSDDGAAFDPLDFASDDSGSVFDPSDDESVSDEESIASEMSSGASSVEEDEDEASSADEGETGLRRKQQLVDIQDTSPASFAPPPVDRPEYLTQLSFNPDGSGPYACASCLESGGELAARAVWCYGRVSATHCRLVPGWQPALHSNQTAAPEAAPSWGPRSHRIRLEPNMGVTGMADMLSPEPATTSPSGDDNIEAVEDLVVESVATDAAESDAEVEEPEEPRARVNRSRVVYTPTGSPPASPPPVRAPSPAAMSPPRQSLALSSLPSSSPRASSNPSPLASGVAGNGIAHPRSLPRHYQPTPPLSSSSTTGRESSPPTVRPARVTLLGPSSHPTPPPSTTDPSCSPTPAARKLPYSKTPAPVSFFTRRSPPQAPSSDPHMALQSSSTPFDSSSDIDSVVDGPPSVASSSPATHRYRSELAVRAADIGMTLGPAPTGRLSSSLLNALAPALRAEQPTLASSISQGAAYTLSPPPAQRRPVDATPRPPPIPAFRPHAPSPATRKPGSGLMLPPPVPATRTRPAVASSSPAAATPSPSPRKRRQRSIDSDELSPTAADFDTAPGPVDFAVPPPRARSRSLSTFSARSSTPSGRGASRPPNSTPRKKTRLELEIEHVAQAIDDDDLEWGMDEDVGADDARQWREGSVVSYV